MRLDVDWKRCAGHGVCSAALGEMVTLDRWGFPVLAGSGDVPAHLAAAARSAAASCPASALRLRKEAGR